MREKHEQLEWEARVGRIAGFACLLAAGLIVASFAWRLGVLPRGADNAKQFLPQVEANKGDFLIAGILTGVAMLAFIPPLLFLYAITRYRRSELPSVARFLIFLGPILFALCSVWLQSRYAHAADQFVAGSVKTNKHAEDVIRDATAAPAGVSLGASVATGLATILTSLNAMRAGLLSRFMGTLGIILGALFVLPVIASPVVQLFWLLALGALFMNIWPGGRGPAWETGEQVPWPSAQGRFAPPPADEPETDVAPEPEPATAAAEPNPRAARKRKKKKARR
jgi:hypothetical protein